MGRALNFTSGATTLNLLEILHIDDIMRWTASKVPGDANPACQWPVFTGAQVRLRGVAFPRAVSSRDTAGACWVA